jgi:1,4-dihydroxy-2-naphthoate octaprenyltransferase
MNGMPAKRCPMCHRASAANAWQCVCGYEFGQDVEKVRALLRDQRTNAWIILVLLLVVDAMAVFGVFYAALHGFLVFSVLGFSALILGTARTVRTLLITRASLRQLASRDDALPRAWVHRRR